MRRQVSNCAMQLANRVSFGLWVGVEKLVLMLLRGFRWFCFHAIPPGSSGTCGKVATLGVYSEGTSASPASHAWQDRYKDSDSLSSKVQLPEPWSSKLLGMRARIKWQLTRATPFTAVLFPEQMPRQKCTASSYDVAVSLSYFLRYARLVGEVERYTAATRDHYELPITLSGIEPHEALPHVNIRKFSSFFFILGTGNR